MAPIATYSEIRFDGKRTFELFPDRIVIHGNVTFKSDFTFSIPLASLRSEPAQVRIRPGAFIGILNLTVISFAIVLIMKIGFSFSFLDWQIWIPIAIGTIGLLMIPATFRKIDHVLFHSDAGVVVIGIARSGKEMKNFDSFVQTLCSQIKKSKGET